MSRRRWLLPETPDVIGLLRKQIAITIDGVDALVAWAEGDAAVATRLRETNQPGDAAKRELLEALRAALVTPLDPEDVFALSRGIDWILDYTRDLVAEAEVLNAPPDPVIAEMARCLRAAVRHIDDALSHVGIDDDAATAAADAAIDAERQLEQVYYRGMGTLLGVEDRSQRIASRELYRRCVRIGETTIDVAERVVYAVVKQG